VSLPVTQLRRIRHILLAGGVVAYPTEGVYGLGCNPADGRAVARVLRLKQRSLSKGLILVASRFQQLDHYLAPVTSDIAQRAFAVWPGPVTWLWPARPWVPIWLRGHHTSLAVRVTDHPVVAALCDALGGPLVSTSANRSGRPPVRSRHVLRRRFGRQVDAIVPGACGDLGRPSEIRELLSDTVVRPR
jgi:L-threonylcarbamoyladenylate synthase